MELFMSRKELPHPSETNISPFGKQVSDGLARHPHSAVSAA
ncbi:MULTISPECIES: hypothetical protein [Prevotella]|nr:hypothetical protein [Prevotella brunnea]